MGVSVTLQQIDAEQCVATITFAHEDHTLGNIFRQHLMAHPDVTAAGYAIPHPLEPRMVVHVQSRQHTVDVAAEALEAVADMCDKTLANFEAAVVAAAGGALGLRCVLFRSTACP